MDTHNPPSPQPPQSRPPRPTLIDAINQRLLQATINERKVLTAESGDAREIVELFEALYYRYEALTITLAANNAFIEPLFLNDRVRPPTPAQWQELKKRAADE